MNKPLGHARRIRARMPFGATRAAWDCRQFGLGRVVAPVIPALIELADGIFLNLENGEIRLESNTARRSA